MGQTFVDRHHESNWMHCDVYLAELWQLIGRWTLVGGMVRQRGEEASGLHYCSELHEVKCTGSDW